MNNARTDGLGIGRHRGGLAWLDELNRIPFRVFRLKPAASVVPGPKFAQSVDTVRAQVLQQAASIARVVRNASHPA
jgi:hypothetical protein